VCIMMCDVVCVPPAAGTSMGGSARMSQPLLIEHHDGADWVTLNRPDSLNALDPSLIDALNVYFQGLQRNRDTRVVVLKGAGASFCAGLDLKHAMKRRAGQQEPPGVT